MTEKWKLHGEIHKNGVLTKIKTGGIPRPDAMVFSQLKKDPRFGRVNPIITCTEGQVGCLPAAVTASNFCGQVRQEACKRQREYSIP